MAVRVRRAHDDGVHAMVEVEPVRLNDDTVARNGEFPRLWIFAGAKTALGRNHLHVHMDEMDGRAAVFLASFRQYVLVLLARVAPCFVAIEARIGKAASRHVLDILHIEDAFVGVALPFEQVVEIAVVYPSDKAGLLVVVRAYPGVEEYSVWVDTGKFVAFIGHSVFHVPNHVAYLGFELGAFKRLVKQLIHLRRDGMPDTLL